MRKGVAVVADAFRDMWMSHNNPEGIELIQGRFSMMEACYRELGMRLDEHLQGAMAGVPE